MKRILCLALVLIMLITVIPAVALTAFADTYDGKLGVIYSPQETTFRLYAPDHTGGDDDTPVLKVYTSDWSESVEIPMTKLLNGNEWTGVWSATVSDFDCKGCAYDFIYENGYHIFSPYVDATVWHGEKTGGGLPTFVYKYYAVCDIENDVSNGWADDEHVFNFEGDGVIAKLEASSFLTNEDSGVTTENLGKYLSLTETGTTLNGAGEYSTGIDYLEKSKIDSVYITVDSSLAPNAIYSSDKEDSSAAVREFRSEIMALHNAGISVIISTIPDREMLQRCKDYGSDEMTSKYLCDVASFWVNQHHADGVRFEANIDSYFDSVRAKLNETDNRIFLSAAGKNDVVRQNWIYNLVDENESNNTKAMIASAVCNSASVADVSSACLYKDSADYDYCVATLAAVTRGKTLINAGDEYGEKSDDKCSWEPIKNNQNFINYYNTLQDLRSEYSPLRSNTGSFSIQSWESGNKFSGMWKNTADGEWSKLMFCTNLSDSQWNCSLPEGDWVVVANSNSVDFEDGLSTVSGDLSIPAKSVFILIDYRSFNGLPPAKEGWVEDDSGRYYYTEDVAVTGWKKIDNFWYYFNSDGKMQTGWLKDGSSWYYLKSNGAMATGWLKDGGKWYYLDSSGAMLANTSRKINGKTYKFNSSGDCTNP